LKPIYEFFVFPLPAPNVEDDDVIMQLAKTEKEGRKNE